MILKKVKYSFLGRALDLPAPDRCVGTSGQVTAAFWGEWIGVGTSGQVTTAFWEERIGVWGPVDRCLSIFFVYNFNSQKLDNNLKFYHWWLKCIVSMY